MMAMVSSGGAAAAAKARRAVCCSSNSRNDARADAKTCCCVVFAHRRRREASRPPLMTADALREAMQYAGARAGSFWRRSPRSREAVAESSRRSYQLRCST